MPLGWSNLRRVPEPPAIIATATLPDATFSAPSRIKRARSSSERPSILSCNGSSFVSSDSTSFLAPR